MQCKHNCDWKRFFKYCTPVVDAAKLFVQEANYVISDGLFGYLLDIPENKNINKAIKDQQIFVEINSSEIIALHIAGVFWLVRQFLWSLTPNCFFFLFFLWPRCLDATFKYYWGISAEYKPGKWNNINMKWVCGSPLSREYRLLALQHITMCFQSNCLAWQMDWKLESGASFCPMSQSNDSSFFLDICLLMNKWLMYLRLLKAF